MPTKEEVLQSVKTLAAQKLITKAELDLAYEAGMGSNGNGISAKRLGIASILSFVGGLVVFFGIVVLVGQNWSTLGFATKTLVTLGAGVAAYFVGLLSGRGERAETLGSAFATISALVLPTGMGVVLDHAGFEVWKHGPQSLISGALFGLYLLSFLILRKKPGAIRNSFMFFTVCFGTWLYFSLTGLLAEGRPSFDQAKSLEYRVLVAGLIYMLLGRAFSKNELAQFREHLTGFGVLCLLGAALSLGGWKPYQNVFWELVYPALVFGVLFLSVQIKSKACLAGGTFFLMAYIVKITSEYFSSGLGWPLTLIITGLAMIGAGYMSLGLKRKYWPA